MTPLHYCYYSIITRSSATVEIVRVGSHYAIPSHSRSLILIPVEKAYATSYYIASRTVFQLSRRICQIIAYDELVPLVNALLLVLGNLFE